LKREKFIKRIFDLRSEKEQQAMIALLKNIPLDAKNPLQGIVQETPKARTPDQNSLMWAGPLKDIAQQAYVDKRRYSSEIWHEHFKREHLPEDNWPELDRMVKDPENWKKWDVTPGGERVCSGSTKDLSPYGMSIYLEKIHADGANLGVMFSANPRQYGD
jgi:hypothetical protein